MRTVPVAPGEGPSRSPERTLWFDRGVPLDAAIARERLSAQLLTARDADGPVAVVERITAVQAQDPVGFRLAVRARSTTASSAEVDRCLTDDRSLVVDWLCRGTLHLVRSEDRAWLHALTTPPLLTSNRRRLEQEGVDPAMAERGVATVSRELVTQGPRTRAQLREALDSAGVRTQGQALVHILGAASFAGLCLRGPMVDGEQAFVDPRDWLGEQRPVDRDAALAELARRYLAGHGPASDRDLAAWSGLGLRDVRAGLRSVGGLVELGGGLVALRAPQASELPSPVLLGPFDPVLHGWASRDWVVGPDEAGVVTSNGLFRPTALVHGAVVATWRRPGGVVELMPRDGATIGRDDQRALDVDRAAVEAWLAG